MDIESEKNLKDRARAILMDEDATPVIRAKAHLMKIEAYHAREVRSLKKKAPDLMLYGSNYLAANHGEIDPEALAILEKRFPVCTNRMIETGFSHWKSYGKHERYFHHIGRDRVA